MSIIVFHMACVWFNVQLISYICPHWWINKSMHHVVLGSGLSMCQILLYGVCSTALFTVMCTLPYSLTYVQSKANCG